MVGEFKVTKTIIYYCSITASFFEAPRVLYASRTHSQLSQAVQELKNTIYRYNFATILYLLCQILIAI